MTPPRVEPPEDLRDRDAVPVGAITREAVIEAAQTVWDDWCSDTGCYPECFTIKRGRLFADFNSSGFATQLAAMLQLVIRKSASALPCLTPAEVAALRAERDAAVRRAEALAAAVQHTFDNCCDEDAHDIDAESLRAALAAYRAASPEAQP